MKGVLDTEDLKVCLMNDSFPPIIDGVANAVLNYAEIITKKLGAATVVTPDNPGAEDDYAFPVVRYKSMSITEKICGYRAGYPFSSSNLEKLSNSGFDIIHSHCPFASTLMARVLREKTGIPIVLTYHTKFDIDIKRAIPNKIMADRAIKLLVTNISACDEVWAVSRGAGENLKSLGFEGKYVVMENGVDFPCGRADDDETAELRAEYGLNDGLPVFLFVGRLLWYKGMREIFDALKILKENNTACHMMIVGDGLDRAEMENYVKEIGISDICIFVGAVYDREDLRVYYTAADLFIFPSLYDTNGIVVREAAACGVPSLLIEGSCAAEGITDGRTGILTQNNPLAISKELSFAADHLDEIHQIGETAMREVYISWETSVKRAYDRYQTVIENMKSGETQRKEGLIQEEFFSTIDDITNSIQHVRSIQSRFTNSSKHFSKKLRKRKREEDQLE